MFGNPFSGDGRGQQETQTAFFRDPELEGC
jgi:hypothetical protein